MAFINTNSLGPKPTLSQLSQQFRATFAGNPSVWLRYVSPLDVAVAARKRGIKITEGRIEYTQDNLSNIYFELQDMSVRIRTLDKH